MPKIQVLDKQVAELIAAGEVVERPSAVIKELVENSLDAGATVITVEIRRGGITYMRVTDNGCGIAPEDVPVAFLRHATSKVSSQEDLDRIGTLGFRGEALASVSAVAHVELFTRAVDQSIGVHYSCGGEEEPELEEAGCPQGTTIVVRDLFFNTPARMKFLKKDVTEGNSVAGVLDKLAMSHPEVSLRLIRDGKEQLHTPGDSKLSSAVYAVYGRDFTSTLIPVDYTLEHVKVNGFVSVPAGCRPNRSMQNFFINGRFIRSRTAMAALEEAFKGSVMVGKFPACVLHLEVAWEVVDVNVHPAKLEVRFVNERPIFEAVYHGVRSALHASDKPKIMELKRPMPSPYTPIQEPQEQLGLPMVPLVLHDSSSPAQMPLTAAPPVLDAVPIAFDFTQSFNQPRKQDEKQEPSHAAERVVGNQENAGASRPQQESNFLPKSPLPLKDIPRQKVSSGLDSLIKSEQADFSSRIIGEAFGTYILVEYSRDELMMIDKHAAHERLLYERLKAAAEGSAAQTLLEPVAVSLEKDEYTAVLAYEKELLKAGFEVSDFGSGTVLVRSAPLLLDGQDAAEAVMEIAGRLASLRTEITTEHLDWVYHNVACRAAMKAGDRTSREELISLAEELERNPQVRYCPHGRPVYILLKRREIEKQFGRV